MAHRHMPVQRTSSLSALTRVTAKVKRASRRSITLADYTVPDGPDSELTQNLCDDSAEEHDAAEVDRFKPHLSAESVVMFQCKYAPSNQTPARSNQPCVVRMSVNGIDVLPPHAALDDKADERYSFTKIPDFHVGAKRKNFVFTFDSPSGDVEKHDFMCDDALRMIGTATAFVDIIVRQRDEHRAAIAQQQAAEAVAAAAKDDADGGGDGGGGGGGGGAKKGVGKKKKAKGGGGGGGAAAAATAATAADDDGGVTTATLPFVKKAVTKWTVDEVGQWLKSRGVKASTVDEFKENDIDGEALVTLDDDDLASMGVAKEANRKRLLRSIKKLRTAKGPRPNTTVL